MAIACSLLSSQVTVLAQNQSVNPLANNITPKDPVIPLGYGRRALSSFEKYRIEKTISELRQSAAVEWEQDNQDEAFTLWYRQLKLIRTLDREAEIVALGDVGAIAWESNRKEDVRNIAERLTTLEAELKNTKSSELLKLLLTAYRQIGYLDRAIEVQNKIIIASRRTDNYSQKVEQANLEILGELYLNSFDYQNAAEIYQSLLSQSDAKTLASAPQREQYLKTLIEIYDRTAKTESAIEAKQRLAEYYAVTDKTSRIPALKIAIARDYETLNQLPQAIDIYEETWQQAEKLQKLAIADSALSSLGKIYQNTAQTDQAIAAYNNLIEIQKQSYNYYGLINTYDILGQIYLKSNQKSQAQQSFQQALELGRSLNYKTDYFNRQLKQLAE